MHRALAKKGLSQVRRTLLPGLLFLLLAACQTISPPRQPATGAEPPAATVSIPTDTPRYRVDPDASEVRLLVYRTGPLARFGHNHVIVGRVRGEIRAGARAAESGFRIEIPVESLSVDAAAARAEEGAEFAADVSEQARRATRENMLGSAVLDAAGSPLIEVESIALVGPRWNPAVRARARLRGATRELRFPAAVMQQGDRLTVIASFQILQSNFGLAPFATLGGALRVRDAIDVRLHLVARRVN